MLGPDCGARGSRWLHSPHQNVIVPRGTAWPVRCRVVACVLSMCHASGAGPSVPARRLPLDEANPLDLHESILTDLSRSCVVL
jgi:hypothetical protein